MFSHPFILLVWLRHCGWKASIGDVATAIRNGHRLELGDQIGKSLRERLPAHRGAMSRCGNLGLSASNMRTDSSAVAQSGVK